MKLPALDQLKMENTGHRLPAIPPPLGISAGPLTMELDYFRPDHRTVYRMDYRIGCARAIPDRAPPDVRRFVEEQMRRDLAHHLYGPVLDLLREAARTARFEGASVTFDQLDVGLRSLNKQMEFRE